MASLINPGIWEGQGVTGGSRPNPHQTPSSGAAASIRYLMAGILIEWRME